MVIDCDSHTDFNSYSLLSLMSYIFQTKRFIENEILYSKYEFLYFFNDIRYVIIKGKMTE